MMILETGDLESVPILLMIALSNDPEDWWVELHLHDGTVREGALREANWKYVDILYEGGDKPFGEMHEWSDVARVLIP